MKKISSSLANKLREDSIVERDYIVFNGETERHYIWYDLYDDCYDGGNFIGTFVMKRIEFKYNDSDLEFKQKEFNAYKEYKLDDGTWESIGYGTFVVTDVEPSDTKEEISVTAYDYTLKFANTYVTDLDYSSNPITLLDVLEECCSKCGVELATKDFVNKDFIVDSSQFDSTAMFGNVVSAVAGISCNFAKIKEDNKLYLEFKNETGIIIELGDYEDFDDKRDTHPYNAVSLGMSNVDGENVTMVDPSVEPGKENYLTINDNPFAYTEEKRGQLIEGIFNQINGFGYSSFVLKNCMYPQLECGDLIKIRNKEGQLVDSIVLRPTYEETEIKLEAPSIINATVKYQNPVSAYTLIKLTQINVNKQEQQIQELIKSQTNQGKTINQVQTNLDKLTEQINENIVIYKGTGVPTLENYPANEWTTNELKDEHVGDLYYDNESKKTYRFDKTGLIYSWVEDTTDISEALELAEKALNVANDKRRVFVTEPTVPYDIGDLWTNGEDIFVCKTAKTEGQSFSQDDWENSNNYAEQIMTTNTKLNETISTLDGTTSMVANLQTTLNNDYLNSEQINAIVQGQDSDIEGLSGKISQLETNADGLSVRIASIENNGVSKVSNTLIELGEDGIQISKSTDEFSSKFDNKGVTFSSYGKVVATYDKDGANIPNLTSDEATLGYLVIKKSETNGEKRTKIFWAGD